MLTETKEERARRLATERMARWEAKQKPDGFTGRQVIAHRDDWPQIRALEQQLRHARELKPQQAD